LADLLWQLEEISHIFINTQCFNEFAFVQLAIFVLVAPIKDTTQSSLFGCVAEGYLDFECRF
jgi:hypothetical protein